MQAQAMSRRTLLFSAAALAAVSRAHASTEQPLVLILTSDASERTVEISRQFKLGLPDALRMSYLVDGSADAGAYLADMIRGQPLNLVFAVGEAAGSVAVREFAGTPVILGDAGSIVNEGRADVFPVSTRVDPNEAIRRLNCLKPGLTRLGVIRAATDRDPFWEQLGAAATLHHVELVVRVAPDSSAAESVAREVRLSSDLLWLVSDRRLWSPELVSRVLHDAWIERFPVVCFDPMHLQTTMPAAAVITTSAAGTGEAAASQALALLAPAGGASRLVAPAPRVLATLPGMRNGGFSLAPAARAVIDEFVVVR